MTTSPDPYFADAFFDAPGLLAVRFARRSSGSANKRLAEFVSYRRPDVSPAVNVATVAKVIGFGVFVAFIGFPMLRSCSSIAYDVPRYGDITNSSAVPLERTQRAAWTIGLERLADDLTPTRIDLRPWMVRTLLDLPRDLVARGADSEDWLQPRHQNDDDIAHGRGQRLAEMLIAAGAARDLAVILDVPGPAAVAAAAGMAKQFEPVFTMDNLPHPNGVVPAMQTLSAVAYWRAEFIAARNLRAPDAPAVFVLEGNRLNPYANEVERFDNRSTVRLPDAEAFKVLGISRILYVRSERGEVVERDDLNERFAELAAAGIEVKYLALASLDQARLVEVPVAEVPVVEAQAVEAQPVEAQPVEAQPVVATGEPRSTSSATTSHQWFWYHYGWYRPRGISWNGPSDPDASYRAVPRSTMFSHGESITALDGGRSQRDTVLTQLTPAPRSMGGGSSGSSSTNHTTTHTTQNHTTTTHSGGSWMRSSSHSSG